MLGVGISLRIVSMSMLALFLRWIFLMRVPSIDSCQKPYKIKHSQWLNHQFLTVVYFFSAYAAHAIRYCPTVMMENRMMLISNIPILRTRR